ncbi:MAG: hypothetical protein K2H01_03225 [Ruminococcus sp.]|nr:hypothetical protein [Ruminococcus sp.]
MNEIEKAIKYLELIRIFDNQNLKKSLDMATKALEKQIPKKPLDVCAPVVKLGICPVCKGEIDKLGDRPNRVFIHDRYCKDCGQAIDWSDENEQIHN